MSKRGSYRPTSKETMKISTLRIVTSDMHCVVGYLSNNFEFTYESCSDEMAVLTSESRGLMHKAPEINMIILKKNNKHIDVDIIEGETKNRLFKLNTASENRFIYSVKKVFDNFCEEFVVPQKSMLAHYR